MKTTRFALLICLVAGSFVTAHADDLSNTNFFVAPSILYYTKLRSRTSKDEKTYLTYELKAGYQFYPEFFAGLVYQGDSDETKTSGYSVAALNNSSKGARSSYGPMIGYISTAFHATFTYFLASEWKLNTTTSTSTGVYKYSGGGFQLDLGYKIPLWGFYFGPQLSYKKFSYSKLSTNGGSAASISPKLEESAIEPSIAFFYFF